jgi:DNA-binding CsgD family transcriptional regulator
VCGDPDAERPCESKALVVETPKLTPREHEVATLVAYGLTSSEVARRLRISVRTAEMHRSNAMRKLQTESRAGVVRWALDHELLH